MSVMFFGADDLGNVAAFLLSSAFQPTKAAIDQVAKDLATISKGNAQAFNAQYAHLGENVKPIASGEILRDLSARDFHTFNRSEAKSTLQLLAYNCVDNNGKEYHARGHHVAMARIMNLAFSRVCDAQEARWNEAHR